MAPRSGPISAEQVNKSARCRPSGQPRQGLPDQRAWEARLPGSPGHDEAPPERLNQTFSTLTSSAYRASASTSTRLSAEQRGAARERLGDLLDDATGLEKAVREGVTTQVALQALDEHDGRHHRW